MYVQPDFQVIGASKVPWKESTYNIAKKSHSPARNEIRKWLNVIFRFTCGICDMKFKVSIHLREQERIHVNDKQYSFVQCTKKFVLYTDLKTHLAVHSENRP